jgi:hypothetical protein
VRVPSDWCGLVKHATKRRQKAALIAVLSGQRLDCFSRRVITELPGEFGLSRAG